MKQYCMQINQQMQQQLAECRNKNVCFEKEVECCFGVATNCCNLVKEKLNYHVFKNEKDEIHFFKHLKPKFTALIEYYSLLYHAIMFQPPDAGNALLFWKREYTRLQKFETEQKSFLLCYNNHRHPLTPYYFLRKYSIIQNQMDSKLYDAGTNASTNGDQLVATFLALKKYIPFVEGKVATI